MSFQQLRQTVHSRTVSTCPLMRRISVFRIRTFCDDSEVTIRSARTFRSLRDNDRCENLLDRQIFPIYQSYLRLLINLVTFLIYRKNGRQIHEMSCKARNNSIFYLYSGYLSSICHCLSKHVSIRAYNEKLMSQITEKRNEILFPYRMQVTAMISIFFLFTV